MEPGRPVGGTYYLYRTLRQPRPRRRSLEQADGAGRRSEADRRAGAARGAARAATSSRAGIEVLKEMIEAEIRRRLVADRGVEAMAQTLRKPLPEDVDFMHASREEMQQLQQGDLPADPRARRAARPQAPPRPHAARSTSAAPCATRCRYGGVPAEPKFKLPAPVEARDHGGRRHLRLGGGVRPLHAAVRLRDRRASSRRCGRSCSSTASTRSPASSRTSRTSPRRSTGSTPRPTSCGSTATPTTATRSRCSGRRGARRSARRPP